MTKTGLVIAMGGVCLVLCLAGCGEEETRYYRAPRQPVSDVGSGDAPGSEREPGAPPRVSLEAPDNWRDIGGGSMRMAGFELGPEADAATLTVTPLNRGMFDLARNIRRWHAQQLGQTPLTDAQYEAMAEPLEHPDADAAYWVELSDETDAISVAIVLEGGWFWSFKLQGPRETVEAAEAELLDFVARARFGDAAEQTTQSGSTTP